MFGRKLTEPKPMSPSFKMINDIGEGFYKWDGNVFKSDIVRACIRPKARAIGKLSAQHIRDNEKEFVTNPDKDLAAILENPNPLMTGQMFQEKMAVQLDLNNNAFALIKRDEQTYEPVAIYPIPCTTVDMLEGPMGDMYLRFYFDDGTQMLVPYVDVIHLRQDFNNHNLFGDSPAQALSSLMEVVDTIDQGMIKAIKNSAAIRWIMKFNQVLKQRDVDKAIEDFEDSFMKVDGESGGVAPADPRYELEQVEPKNYVPDDKQINNTTKRIYDFFNTNENIVQSKYNEDEWNAYYESVVEPVAKQLAGEYSKKIFSSRQRKRGNRIVFESASLQYASMSTKLGLERMVDRASLTPNEWRKILNLTPIEGGDEPIRRKDTGTINEGGDNGGQVGNAGTSDSGN